MLSGGKNAVGALSLPERPSQACFYSQDSALPITPAPRHPEQTPQGAAPCPPSAHTDAGAVARGHLNRVCT